MNKFIWTEKDSPTNISNKDLVCKDCFHMVPPRADICSWFPNCKPLKILAGGTCPHYKKKN